MRYRHLAIIICLALLPTIFLNAQTTRYYVSPSGSDKSFGTEKRPWKTLEYAFGQIQKAEGDVTLTVMDGEYAPEATLALSGIKGRKVTVEAAQGATPRIMGEKRLSFKKLKGKSMLVADLKAAGIKDYGSPCKRENLVDLYWKGERQTLARYPNEGFIRAGQARGETFTWEDKNTKEGVFEYKEDRISSWIKEKEPYVYGYFCFDWLDSYQKIVSIDPVTKTMTLQEPWHVYGYSSGFRYYGVNLFCELDAPGEYYIDRDKGRLYWIPPEGYSAGDEVTVSSFSGEYSLEIIDCEDVAVKGLTFSGGRGTAVKVESSTNVALEDLGIYRYGGDAIIIDHSKGVTVSGGHMETMGHGIIKAYGGDRKTLEHADYRITNIVARDFSLFKHTYEPAVFFEGCGLTVDHCDLSVCPSSALRLDGSDILVEYNYFHDLVKESDDQGVIDMWYNYAFRGVVIRYNLFEDVRGGSLHGAAGVRFDDMISGQMVYGNIFNNVGAIHFGAVQIHGGKDNVVDNNVFYNCDFGVSFSPWGQALWDEALTRPEVVKKLYEDVDINGELYQSRYPDLAKDIHANVNRNIIINNLVVGCHRMFYDDKGQNYMKNNHGISIGEDPVTESLEYYLNPEVLQRFGLKPIPWKEIGLSDRPALLLGD